MGHVLVEQVVRLRAEGMSVEAKPPRRKSGEELWFSNFLTPGTFWLSRGIMSKGRVEGGPLGVWGTSPIKGEEGSSLSSSADNAWGGALSSAGAGWEEDEDESRALLDAAWEVAMLIPLTKSKIRAKRNNGAILIRCGCCIRSVW